MTISRSTLNEIYEHFGVAKADQSFTSLYEYGPVFKTKLAGQPVVLKKTIACPGATGIAEWTTALATRGLDLTAPLDLPVANPYQHGDDVWVLKPWVDGTHTTGSAEQLHAAGELLGAMHALGTQRPVNAPVFKYAEYSQESVEEDVAALEKLLPQHAPDVADQVLATFVPALRSLWDDTQPVLVAADLPRVMGSLDFRAVNLIYRDGYPVLIDSENGEFVPRLLDLALAALTFHHESPNPEQGVLNEQQWARFAAGYRKNVALSDVERELWPAALRFMYFEWVTWYLIDAAQCNEWHTPAKAKQLRSLATVELTAERWPLP